MHLEGNINSSSIHVFWYNMYRIEVNRISMNGTGHFVLLSYDFQFEFVAKQKEIIRPQTQFANAQCQFDKKLVPGFGGVGGRRQGIHLKG